MPPPSHPGYDVLKRVLDVTIAASALVVFSPIWLVLGCAVKLTSPGPVLFTRTVVGRRGRRFTYFKYRTMRHNNDDSAHLAFLQGYVKEDRPFAVEVDERTGKEKPVFKVVNDSRVTRVGRLLRKTSLDEIPQLINVLRGEMSIVGPRPPIEYEYGLYDEKTKARLAVLPGITGWAQVKGRGNTSFAGMCALDLEYIRRRSVAFDLKIMFVTAGVMVKGA